MKNKKTFIFIAVVVIFLVVGGLVDIFFWKIITVKGKFFISELPSTQEDYQKGLGGRKNLCRSCAMLFRFPRKGEYTFWMKDMHFDLDILWIADGKIVYIEKNFSKDSKIIVNPGVFADEVLEVNAGTADKYGFGLGTWIEVY